MQQIEEMNIRTKSKLIAFLTDAPKRVAPEMQSYFVGVVVAYLFALIYHIVFAMIFKLMGIRELYIYQFFSVPWLFFGLVVTKTGRPILGMVFSSIEFTVHAALGVMFLGWESGLHYPMLLITIYWAIIPGKRKPAFWIPPISNTILYLALRYIFFSIPPRYLLNPSLIKWLSIFMASTFLAVLPAIFVIFSQASQWYNSLQKEREKSDKLLLNILPGPIADRLKADESTIADGFTEASIFFCDIVDFTVMSSGKPPEEVVDILNELFSRIDGLLDEYSMEKIKTIGDAYMAVCGIPEPVEDHAYKAVSFAEAVQDRLSQFNEEKGLAMQLRYGVNSGPVVAGVIGTRKFIYDLWGDTVNTASRMESYGIPGRIQITPATKERLNGKCIYESRGEIEIKGKGMMETFLVSTVEGGACASCGNDGNGS